MSVPVITFFNNKGGVGKTSLVYHVAWMLAESGREVMVADLDPQANLTAAFLSEKELEVLWDGTGEEGNTIARCLAPLTRTGDIRPPGLRKILPSLSFLPGDLALSGFEDTLSAEWPNCRGNEDGLYRAFRVETAFWQVLQKGADTSGAELILVDVGPSLGAINRAALIATDFVVVPLGADLFSRQGLRNLGPTLRSWREVWAKARENWKDPEFELPSGSMKPIGYILQQYIERSSRPVQAYARWTEEMPSEYAIHVLNKKKRSNVSLEDDPNCIATIRHYRSLVPLGQQVRKPIFNLTPADGAIGSHAASAKRARADFQQLSKKILARTGPGKRGAKKSPPRSAATG